MDKKKWLKKVIIEIEKEIIFKPENGICVSKVSIGYRIMKSTICVIYLMNTDELKSAQLAKGITKFCKLHSNFIEEMENWLLAWIKEREIASDCISKSIICAKAKQLFNDFRANAVSRILLCWVF